MLTVNQKANNPILSSESKWVSLENKLVAADTSTDMICKIISQMKTIATGTKASSETPYSIESESENFPSTVSPMHVTKGGPKSKGMTLQFIGIRRPSNEHVIAYPLGKKSNITSVVVDTSLSRTSSVCALKKLIKSTYSIPLGYDLFILYAHIVISMNDNATLKDYGITNNSLLTVAVIKSRPDVTPRNNHNGKSTHQHISRSLSSTEKTMKKGTDIGLDIITQETGVNLYRMPVCGHLMSRQSLFHYANSCIVDPSTICLSCPHSKPMTKEDMSILWESPQITVQKVSEFMDQLPSKFKTKIWKRHCNGRYIEPSEILFTLRSFVALFIRLQDRKTDYSSLRTAITKRLVPFAEAVRTRTESPDGMSLQEFNEVLHLWILKPLSETIQMQSSRTGRRGLYGDGQGLKYDDQWSCTQCTYLNSTKSSDQCTMCGHQRTKTLKMDVQSKNQCGAEWHYSLIKQVLVDGQDGKEQHSEDFDCSKLEALSARNKLQSHSMAINVQKCCQCNTVHFKHEDPIKKVRGRNDYKKLKTQCVLCDAHFCWNCGQKFDDDHICDSDKMTVFEETVTILRECSTKTIGPVDGVPSIRACPNPDCGQLITHWEECKHMKCEKCWTEFCFVCMLPKEDDYWQCGEYDDECDVAPRQTLHDVFDESNVEITLKKSFQLF